MNLMKEKPLESLPIYSSKDGGFLDNYGNLKYPFYCGAVCDIVGWALVRVAEDPRYMQRAYTDILNFIIREKTNG